MQIPRISTAISAALVLVGFDIWLGLAHPLSSWPTPNLERSHAYKALESFDREVKPLQKSSPTKASPNVGLLLFGSSLMVSPTLQLESVNAGCPFDQFTHVRLQSLENNPMLSKQWFSKTCPVFSLALSGEMASDAFMVLKHVLSSGTIPSAIIYGVAPRDFQDNLLGHFGRSEIFQVVGTPADLADLAQQKSCSIPEFIELVLGRFSKFWLYRSDVRKYAWLNLKKNIDRLSPVPLFVRYHPVTGKCIQKQGQFPEDAPGSIKVIPGLPVAHLSAEDTAIRYSRSYNPVDPDLVDTQFTYFSKFLGLVNKNGIKVAVVNMPLSTSNRKLLSKGFYDSYLKRVKTCCTDYGVQFCNLQTPSWDDEHLYPDTVHISPQASKRFAQELFSAVASQSEFGHPNSTL